MNLNQDELSKEQKSDFDISYKHQFTSNEYSFDQNQTRGTSDQSTLEIQKKIQKYDQKKKTKRGRKALLKMKLINYGYQAANCNTSINPQDQILFEESIYKVISNQKVFLLAGDVLAELKGASHEMGIDVYFEQIQTIYMEKLQHGIQFETFTCQPLKNFKHIIYQMENSQDQQLFEFSQSLKQHQELVDTVSAQIQEVQMSFKDKEQDLQFILSERQKIKNKQRKLLLEHMFNQGQFCLIATVSLSFSNQTTTISNMSFSRPLMSLIRCENQENICDILKFGFFRSISQNSNRQFMKCNLKAQQSQEQEFNFEFDNVEFTTYDQIKITCKGGFQAIKVLYPEHLKLEKYPILNIETFYIGTFDLSLRHIEQILNIRKQQTQISPQNNNFPKNYNYDDFVEVDIFEYSIQSQIFLEKFYQKELEKIQLNKKKQIQRAAMLTCGYRNL